MRSVQVEGRYSCQQRADVLGSQAPVERVAGVEHACHQLSLARCECEHLLLNGVRGDQAIDVHGAGLPDPVGAVDRLRFDGRVPPRVEQEDVVGLGQVQARTRLP